ncbi:hypothetical protein CY35_19G037600 [Sphagnum magellanicum]|nr:hypothetical protein CY35_19G037600 [Sphagnum magellanicum]
MSFEGNLDVVMHNAEVAQTQGVVLVVLDVNKDISTSALQWALGHVVRKGDTLRVIGIISHILNPLGYKCRVDDNSWTGANRKILENELAHKRFLLQNIQDFDVLCQKAGVESVIEVRAAVHPRIVAVDEARTYGAYHVVLDRTMKKDRKYFVDNLTCFVTRVRNSGGVDSIRSFAISKELPPTQRSYLPPKPPPSEIPSMDSSLHGSSLSSTSFNEENNESYDAYGPATLNIDGIGSSRSSFTSQSSFEIHENLESSDKHCIGQSPNCDPGPMMQLSVNKGGLIRSSLDRAASGQLGSPQTTMKTVWIWTKNKDVFTTSVESGWTTFIFTSDTKHLVEEWTSIAQIKPLYLDGEQFLDSANRQVAGFGQVSSCKHLDVLPASIYQAEVIVIKVLAQQFVPAEKVVAAFQHHSTTVYATASTSSEAQVYLEALEKGTDGIVLQTDDPREVFAFMAYLNGRRVSKAGPQLVQATVTQVEPVGTGDCVCVDLCNLLNPGEGLLVGSYERALFLVHSECMHSNNAAHQPFRVNAMEMDTEMQWLCQI